MRQRASESRSATKARSERTEEQPESDLSPEEFRLQMLRRMNDVTRAWRQCPAPLCRRARRCADRRLRCVRALASLSPQAAAHASRSMRAALEAQLREQDDGNGRGPE